MRGMFKKTSILIFSLTLLLAATSAFSQTPILDRELFFGDPEISGAQLSPDGKFMAFVKPYKGTRNIWVKKTDEPFNAAKPVTDDQKRPVVNYFWSRDGKYILFSQDKGGDENFNVYAVNPTAPIAAGREVPAARNLTDLQGIRAFIYSTPKSDPDALFVGLNDRDNSWHDLYKIKISTGERTLIRRNDDHVSGWLFDQKDQLRLATRTADNGDSEVLTVGKNDLKKVYSCNVFETCAPVRFHKDNRRIYMMTNRGSDDLIRLVLFDPETLVTESVETDPLKRVDFGGPIFSDVTDELIATSYEDERTRIYWRDKEYEADYKLLQSKLPNRDISFDSSTADEKLWKISASSDTEPGEAYLFDRTTKALTLQYRVFDKLPRAHLATMKSISYASSDGVQIPAFLTLPKGVETSKNLPMVVFPHGGPWARDSWGYNPYAQFLANRGYAVLQPNFRSSVGYGKKFLNAGNKQWGEKMQDDLTWGVKAMVAQGIADPKRVGIMGGSYGGYAVLAGLTFTPDVYAAGVSIVGPSNLITLLASIPPYWEAGRKIFNERMGDPSTSEGRTQLERQSPLNSATRIKSPLLVIQGANDPRVKKAESDQIVIALRDRGFAVEYIVAPDEGHGFARPVNNMAMIAAAEKFLAKHLGGRFQQGATPEVAARLKEITVDVKTVENPKTIAATVTTPKPAVDLKPIKLNYKAKIELGGQAMEMTTSTEIKEQGGSWLVSEIEKTPQGEVTDMTVLEKGSLVVSKRSIKQGPVAAEVDFKSNKASGAFTINGQAKPIAADTGGPLFADGAGAYSVVGALPLADGYSATFRNFDLQKQITTLKQLKVIGSEKVTVPAGSFDAFKVEITSAEGDPGKTTIWIAKPNRNLIKVVAIVPQNGAVITSELVQ